MRIKILEINTAKSKKIKTISLSLIIVLGILILNKYFFKSEKSEEHIISLLLVCVAILRITYENIDTLFMSKGDLIIGAESLTIKYYSGLTKEFNVDEILIINYDSDSGIGKMYLRILTVKNIETIYYITDHFFKLGIIPKIRIRSFYRKFKNEVSKNMLIENKVSPESKMKMDNY